MSLDESEPVDSVLTFPSGYDTLEYSWVKATMVSVCLRILFVTLQSTNKLSDNLCQIHSLDSNDFMGPSIGRLCWWILLIKFVWIFTIHFVVITL